MKIRKGFVSNSSSSSFVIADDEEQKRIEKILLRKKKINKIKDHVDMIEEVKKIFNRNEN